MLSYITAFLNSGTGFRSLETYLTNFDKLAQSGVNIILFLDEQLRNTPEEEQIKQYQNVQIVEYITIDKSWLPESILESQLVLPTNRHQIKDSISYMAIQLMKLKLVNDARKYTDSEFLAWIDFGIFQMIKDIPNAYKQLQSNSSRNDFPKDKIISPSPGNYNTSTDIWNSIIWHYSGSFFISHRDLIPIAHQRQTELVITGLPKIVWEINYWHMMEDMFITYYGNHNDTILNIPSNFTPYLTNSQLTPGTITDARTISDDAIIQFIKPYTSVSLERIKNVLKLVENAINNNIEGDFVEIGVWKGGLIMAMVLKYLQMGGNTRSITHRIHAYDTFTGMTQPTVNDVDISGKFASDILASVACICPYDEFINNLAKIQDLIGRLDHNDIVITDLVVIHRGDILTTPLGDIPDKIAVLRLDTDWYESTRFELQHFEPRVSDFGYVIVDDYGHWKGARKAVDEFQPPYINKIDYTGIWWQKDFGKSILHQAVIDHPECETARILYHNFHHFINIHKVLNGAFWRGCGSYMFDGQIYKYQRETLKKQEALFNVGKKCNRVLEIGVYLGHSLFILLCSNPNMTIDCVDIDGSFSPKVVEYLNSQFGNRITFYKGSARDILPGLKPNTYDLIHIDADHYVDAVIEQFTLSLPLAKDNRSSGDSNDVYIVFDDYEAVRQCIDKWISNGILEHVFTPWCLWTNIVTRLLTKQLPGKE